MSDETLLSRLSPAERRAIEALSASTGFSVSDLAREMVAAYLRLVLDAPSALPDRPLLGLIRRAKAGAMPKPLPPQSPREAPPDAACPPQT